MNFIFFLLTGGGGFLVWVRGWVRWGLPVPRAASPPHPTPSLGPPLRGPWGGPLICRPDLLGEIAAGFGGGRGPELPRDAPPPIARGACVATRRRAPHTRSSGGRRPGALSTRRWPVPTHSGGTQRHARPALRSARPSGAPRERSCSPPLRTVLGAGGRRSTASAALVPNAFRSLSGAKGRPGHNQNKNSCGLWPGPPFAVPVPAVVRVPGRPHCTPRRGRAGASAAGHFGPAVDM